MRRTWLLALSLASPAASSAATAEQPPAPDFSGTLRAGLPVAAWFDAARSRGFLRVGDFTSKLYRAWKVELADLDGDGTREILLGIWSNQPRHDEPQPHRTVWVLRWDDDQQRLVEAWRGSALARPLRDFTTSGALLIAREQHDQTCLLTTYQWNGFGFVSNASRPATCDPRP